MKKTIYLASRNQGKIQEYKQLLKPLSMNVLGIESYPALKIEETGSSFKENAFIKGEIVAEATGSLALADDSGLEVPALSNTPGIYSARFSSQAGGEATDEANMALLLEKMQLLEEEERKARFCCVIALVAPKKFALEPLFVQGEWWGRIAFYPKGSQGFGYDPVFFDPFFKKTAAELTPEEKNLRSHRGQAVEKLIQAMPNFLDRWNIASISS